MNQALQVFQNEQFGQVRVIEKDGEPWFVARDVCEALELDLASGARGLDADEKGLHSVQTPGGVQEVSVISEPGLYSLILRSRKPEAKTFKRWITHEVIPSIRKTGGYAIPRVEKPSLKELAEAEKAFRISQRLGRSLKLDSNTAIFSAAQVTKRITGVDVLALMGVNAIEAPTQEKHFTPTQLGGMFGGKSGKAMNKELETAGMQKRTPHGAWIVTEKGKAFSRLFDTAKQHSDGAPVTQIKWSESVLKELE